MKRLIIFIIIGSFFAGCAAYVTPEGTYIEPLPFVFFGPPVIIASPPHVVVRRLPPVYVVTDRHVYYYGDIYYYYWDDVWYYGERDRGPWHKLPKKYYPPRYRSR